MVEGVQTAPSSHHASPEGDAAQVVTLGEAMVLFWPADAATLEAATRFERSFGGAEANFAIALTRLGHRTRWISRLGDDAFGRYIRRELLREGVCVDAQADSAAATAVFFKERVSSGPRKVYYYRQESAASRLRAQDITPRQFAGVRALHITGITPALSPECAGAVERAIDLARSVGALVAYDPNVRLQLWRNRATCVATLRRLVSMADLVLLGHEDGAVLYGDLGPREIMDAVRSDGCSAVVVKLGERGAIATDGVETVQAAAWPIAKVVDTVGAGDGFDAGYLAGWLRGFPVRQCLDLAARVGAGAVAAAGDWEGYPTAAEAGLAPDGT